MTPRALPLLAVLTFGAAGCSGVRVTPTGADVGAAPRAPDCTVDFLFEPPGRPYDALADLQSQVTSVPSGGAWLVLRAQACGLGADAVIVTRNQVLNYYGHTMVDGTAIKYRAVPAAAPQSPSPAEAPAAPPVSPPVAPPVAPPAAPPAAPPPPPEPKPAP